MPTTTSAPERAEGLELLGALGGSGYASPTYLVRRADGQTLQLTPLLYHLLEELDGVSEPDALAVALSGAVGRTAAPEDVEHLVGKLGELGLLRGSEAAAAPTSNPLLALRWKLVVSDPRTTRRLTAPFAALFTPWVMWPVLVAFVGVCWFVLVDKGLASATRSAFDSPGLLLGVFALAVLSAGFHELGHAAACRYGGATPGAMGMGLYLVWPAFYTDVDDSYRLDRRGRLRVDLGGLYFNAVAAVAVTAVWLLVREDALLLGVAVQLLQMVRQLAPVVRADGYHILADLTGVPDLFTHLGPTLKRLLPSHWGRPSPLTRKARWIVTAWVAVVVPVLVSMLATAVLVLPRLVATAWHSGRFQLTGLGAAAESADLLGVGAALLRLAALLLPVLGTTYLLSRLVRRTTARTWTATRGRPVARTAAATAGALLVAAVAWAWWPHGQYQPVRSDERGTLPSLVQHLSAAAEARPAVTGLRTTRQVALAMVPRGAAAKDHPVLLLTRGADGTRSILTTGTGGTGRAFPFTLPRTPGPGDTQALAVNDTDGAVVYDVAYALVTVTDGAPVTNANTAWALASCHACTTVAVSFQVVLVVGQSDVVVPVNAAVAANSACVQCVTSALAVQLVVTLNAQPDAQVQSQLNAALAKLDGLEELDLATVYGQLQEVQQEVLTVLQDAGLVDATATTVATATASPSSTASPQPSALATRTAAPVAEPVVSPDPTPTAEPTPTASPSDSPTPSASP